MGTSTKISLNQWRTLVSVVEAGGYAQAAEQLHKSQSTLVYAVQKMEKLLEVEVFKVTGRKAVLTHAGQILYRCGKTLTEQAAHLEHIAANLADNREPELRLAVDTVFPTWLLLKCFAQFAGEHPEIHVELIETGAGGIENALLKGYVDLAIGSSVPPGFIGEPLMQARFIAVAHPDHPLHRLGRPLTPDDLRQHRQLTIHDRGQERLATSGRLKNGPRWTVNHKATSIHAACMGLGYAWYAEDTIRAELEAGELKPLPLCEGAERWTTLYLVFTDPDTTGPGALRFADIIRAGIAQHCPATGLSAM